MTSAKIITGEHLEEIRQRVAALQERERIQADDYRELRFKLLSAEKAVEALRANQAGLEKLLKKEAARLEPEDKTAVNIAGKLGTLQKKAKKAVRQYDKPSKIRRMKLLAEVTAGIECVPDEHGILLEQVDALVRQYQAEERQQKRRMVIASLALIALPLAGYILGTQAVVPWEPSAPSVVLPINEGGQITAPPQNAPPPQQYLYIVKSGDSLSKIAQFFYGDTGEWERIYEANKSQLPNPDVIEVGQQLVIP